MEKIIIFLRQFGLILMVGVVGILSLIIGLWGQIRPQEEVVEIIKNENKEQSNIEYREVMVDVAGAVEKPGLYKLPSGSRIGDALVMAGGLSVSADRDRVSKTINLAEVLKDGGKIFIPDRDSSREQSNIEYRESQGLVNINTASLAELDALSGIGEVRAKTIIENRPYGSIEELVSKAKIPESVVEKIKDRITVY